MNVGGGENENVKLVVWSSEFPVGVMFQKKKKKRGLMIRNQSCILCTVVY